MRLQTLRNTAVGAHARSTDPALILLPGVGASFDFDFNDYLHIASLSAAPQPSATARNARNPDLVHFPLGNFFTSSVIIVSPVSGNRLRTHTTRGRWVLSFRSATEPALFCLLLSSPVFSYAFPCAFDFRKANRGAVERARIDFILTTCMWPANQNKTLLCG
jgi:hypothetical protein